MESNWHVGDFIPIPAYRSKYGINKYGDVISYIRWRNPVSKLLTPWISKHGYKNVTLINMENSNQKNFLIHRLLAEIFFYNYNPSLQINHKDGNKLNNDLSNLEMVTPRENMEHAAKIGLMSKKLNPLQVKEIKYLINAGILTQIAISKIYGVDPTTIYNIKSGKSWNHI